MESVVKKNPELADRFSEKMLESQRSTEEFLVRHDLLNGPDDKPTIVGKTFRSLSSSGVALIFGYITRNPLIPGLLFGASAQVAGFQEAEEAGEDPFTAKTIGTLQGIVEGGASYIGMDKVIGILGSVSKSAVKKILASAAVEALEEGVTQTVQQAITEVTDVTDLTPTEFVNGIIQGSFFGFLGGGLTVGGITTTESIVRRFVGDTTPALDVAAIAAAIDEIMPEIAVQVAEQLIDDIDVELEVSRDAASDSPVTQAARATKEQQERVVKIMQDINEGKAPDFQALVDEIREAEAAE